MLDKETTGVSECQDAADARLRRHYDMDHQHNEAAVCLNQFKHQVQILFVHACVNMYLSWWITEPAKHHDLPARAQNNAMKACQHPH